MQEGSTLIRKPARKVSLALREKFKQEIYSMVKAEILTEVTPEMYIPEWLNSFIIVKKPSGNLSLFRPYRFKQTYPSHLQHENFKRKSLIC